MKKDRFNKSNYLWFIISLLIIVLDQISKYAVLKTLSPYHPQAIAPMLNLTLAFNTGAAFSFLSGTGLWGTYFFAMFSGLMSIAIAIWMVRLQKNDYFSLLGLSLILGGALGNLIDRLLLGHVIDFIDCYIGHYHWPVFNLADSAICIGAVVLLLSSKPCH